MASSCFPQVLDVVVYLLPDHCITAANLFKVTGPHNGLVLARSHSLLELGPHQLAGLWHCCLAWFNTTHHHHPHLASPMLIWDTLDKAGASQVHPHLQVWLGSHYEGEFERWVESAARHQSDTGRDYWADMVEAHDRCSGLLH